jgi:hypothetical protein
LQYAHRAKEWRNLPNDISIPDSVQSGILSNSIYNTTLKINDDRITEFLTFAECLVFQKNTVCQKLDVSILK